MRLQLGCLNRIYWHKCALEHPLGELVAVVYESLHRDGEVLDCFPDNFWIGLVPDQIPEVVRQDRLQDGQHLASPLGAGIVGHDLQV